MSYDAYTHYYTHSAMTEESYPYEALNGVCREDEEASTGVRTTSYVTVPFDDVPQMKEALALNPLNLSIYASAPSFRSYTSGILNDPTCGNVHNHAVLLVGWGIENDVEYWTVKNSWGPDWGESGFIRIAITDGDGICGTQMWPIYPIVA